MVVSLAWAALRRRPFSVLCTLLLDFVWASLLGLSAPLTLLVWLLGSLALLELWLVVEPTVLEWCGCREPNRGERERLTSWAQRLSIQLRVCDDPIPFVASALRAVIVSSGALELFEDRALFGLVAQAATAQRASGLIREGLVWLGNLPLLASWFASRCLGQLGRLLAIAIGSALWLPVLIWPNGFVRWAGRLLGAVFVVLLGATLVSDGLAAPGLTLLLAWALLPGLRSLLAWELRRAEAEVDLALIRSNVGWQLLEGLERLYVVDPAEPRGLLALLARPA